MNKNIPPFNKDRQIKTTLCHTMLDDSNDFLIRVNLLMKDNNNLSTSYLSKIYVDILISIESSLKSLIISLSKNNETPEDAYKKARNCSHKIDFLYEEVKVRAYNRISLLKQKDRNELLNNAIKIRVDNRYRLVTLAQIRSDGNARYFGTGQYSNLINYDYLLQISEIAFKLKKIAFSASGRFLNSSIISGTNMRAYDNRFRDFLKNVKVK